MSLESETEEFIIMLCLFDNNPLKIPREMINEQNEIKSEYRGTTRENGIYISPQTGAPYCCRECLIKFCED
jgi:hypothetical protein